MDATTVGTHMPESTTDLYPTPGIEDWDIVVIVAYFVVILAVGIWVSKF